MKYNALHDMLTGLPNRRLFRDRLTNDIIHASCNQECLAVMFLDLDRFKYVNDTLGHDIGDSLLKSTADLLTSIVGTLGIVSRIGGDEFTIILEGITKEEVANTPQFIPIAEETGLIVSIGEWVIRQACKQLKRN